MVTLNRHLLQHYKQYRKKHKIGAADFSFYIVRWEILNLSCFTIDPNRVIVRAINLHKKGEKGGSFLRNRYQFCSEKVTHVTPDKPAPWRFWSRQLSKFTLTLSNQYALCKTVLLLQMDFANFESENTVFGDTSDSHYILIWLGIRRAANEKSRILHQNIWTRKLWWRICNRWVC